MKAANYSDKQLRDFSFELGWFKENFILNEIEKSKKLIKTLKSEEFILEHSFCRNNFDSWVEDGIKMSIGNIERLSNELSVLMKKRANK